MHDRGPAGDDVHGGAPQQNLLQIFTALPLDASVHETMQAAAEFAVTLFDGCSDASLHVSGCDPSRTSTRATALDDVQLDSHAGPSCVVRDAASIASANDLSQDDRWPEFVARAVELGVHAVLALRLPPVEEDNTILGVLTLYSERAGAFDAEAIALATAYAAHCSAILRGATERDGLQAALVSRDVIGQAKGILMERHRITSEEAFEMLTRISQSTNRKVREVATDVATTGALPGGQT